MSIIYDALKKVEKSDILNKDNKPKENRGNYWVYISLICFGIFITSMFLFTMVSRNKAVLAAKGQKKYISRQADHLSDKIAQTISTGSKLSLILNGVFFSGDKGYALINNEIFKEGDVIKGAKISKISLDEVVLEVEGNAVRLVNKK